MSLLEKIHSGKDVQSLTIAELEELSSEIRAFLLSHVSKTGGHLASNLGIVEITIAIHNVFDSNRDRILFDVGHQTYVHKILTGRAQKFDSLRSYGGLSGFPKPSESVSDAFTAGHASSSVSTALGMARARTIQNEDYSVVAVVGDGAAGGGIFYEGMNDAGSSGEPLIVILNDNGMSISKNVGGVAGHLRRLRLKPGYFGLKKKFRKLTSHDPLGQAIYQSSHRWKQWLKRSLLGQTIFEDMGFLYLGPVDGHDIRTLSWLLKRAKEEKCPVLIHAITKKGKGYLPAEEKPSLYHGVPPFDLSKGVSGVDSNDFSAQIGSLICEEAAHNDKLCAITAGMSSGTGLGLFERKFHNRFFDVGIAEEHAVSMAAGMAKQGLLPVIAVYSTFLQRAYDMLLQDIGLQQLHVILCVDRCGIVGSDGETHHGLFDLGYLRHIPGITILSPATFCELRECFQYAVTCSGPVIIRYSRGPEVKKVNHYQFLPAVLSGPAVTVFSYGILSDEIITAAEELEKSGIIVHYIRAKQVIPLNYTEIIESCRRTKHLYIPEEQMAACAVGPEVAATVAKDVPGLKFSIKNCGNCYVKQGDRKHLLQSCGLDAAAIAGDIMEVI